MAITTATILDRVETTLLDVSNVAWSRNELLDYLNATMRFICSIKPDAYVVNSSVSITTNETRQALPTGGYQLLRVVRNMGANGTTKGAAITKVEANHLDRVDPTWHTTVGSAVKHYALDPRNPDKFWLYPSLASTWYVELEYAAIPSDATDGGTVAIKDIYESPLYWGTLALAYAKNAKRGDAAKETGYVQMLISALGNKDKVQQMFSPTPTESDTNQVQ